MIVLILNKLHINAKLVSLEQFPQCIEVAKTLIPLELMPYIEIIHSEAVIYKIEEISRYRYFSGYKNLPNNKFDFLLIDGPGEWVDKESGELIKMTSADIVRLMPNLIEGALIYIDKRQDYLDLIDRYLGNYFEIIDQTKYRDYTLFKYHNSITSLSDLKIHDKKLEKLKKDGYLCI